MGQGGEILGSEAGIDSRTFHNCRSADASQWPKPARPWFVCRVYSGGRYCGRRVAVLYGAGELFACRRCYGLAYASQHEALRHRGLWKAQKIRMRLGGSPSLADVFPDRPKGMHWRTYHREGRVRLTYYY